MTSNVQEKIRAAQFQKLSDATGQEASASGGQVPAPQNY
jgi:hypothetical protein